MKYYKQAMFLTFITMSGFLKSMENHKVINPLHTLNNRSNVKLEDRTLYLYLNLTPSQSSNDAEISFTAFCERFRGKKNLQEIYNSEPVDEILKAYSILSTPEFKKHYDESNCDLTKFYGKERLDLYSSFNALEKMLHDEDTAYNASIKNPAERKLLRSPSSKLTTDAQLLNHYFEITHKFSPYRFPEGSIKFIEAEKTIDKVKESYAFLGEPKTRKIYDKNNNKRSFLVALKINDALERLKDVVYVELPSQERLSPQPSRSFSLKLLSKHSPETDKRSSLGSTVTEALISTVGTLVSTVSPKTSPKKGSKLAKVPEIIQTNLQPLQSIEAPSNQKTDEKEL